MMIIKKTSYLYTINQDEVIMFTYLNNCMYNYNQLQKSLPSFYDNILYSCI